MFTLIRLSPILRSSAPYVGRDVGQEFVAVGIDLLDIHHGDHEAQLSENDVFGDLLDLLGVLSEQPSRRHFP